MKIDGDTGVTGEIVSECCTYMAIKTGDNWGAKFEKWGECCEMKRIALEGRETLS